MADLERARQQIVEDTHKIFLLRGGRADNPQALVQTVKAENEGQQILGNTVHQAVLESYPFEFGILAEVVAREANGEAQRVDLLTRRVQDVLTPGTRHEYKIDFKGKPGNFRLQKYLQLYKWETSYQPSAWLEFCFKDNQIHRAKFYAEMKRGSTSLPVQLPDDLNRFLRYFDGRYDDILNYGHATLVDITLTDSPRLKVVRKFHLMIGFRQVKLEFKFDKVGHSFTVHRTPSDINRHKGHLMTPLTSLTPEGFMNIYKSLLALVPVSEHERAQALSPERFKIQ